MQQHLKHVSGSYKGGKRDKNKDKVWVSAHDEYMLYLVFDGISSAENATSAIKKVISFISNRESEFLGKTPPRLADLMLEANKHLVASDISDGFSTYALVYVSKKSPRVVRVGNLGDTRIYIVTKQALKQVTQDHQVINSPNIVTKYLGMLNYSREDFETSELTLSSEENRVLICSDGFYEALDEKYRTRFHRILNFKYIGNVRRYLERAIKEFENQDDATYILIDIPHV